MKKVIRTEQAPAARGNYSQGIVWGDLLFVSGQLPLDPLSGKLVSGDLKEQAERAMLNLQAIVQAAGSDMDCVLKTTLYITDIAHWDEVNRIYGTFFSAEPPARAVVPVKELHFGALVEIEAIAALKNYSNTIK